MPGILDQLAGLDTGVEELALDTFDDPPLVGEMPEDTFKRQQKEAIIAERQKIKDEQAFQTQQRMTGLDFASRSIPSYRDNGTVKPVTDSTGAPLTQLDKSNSIAWDSLGEAKKIVYGAKGPPVLSDPFETASDEIDKKGNTYKVTPGLPWKWTGTDADTVADSEQKTREIAVRKAASAVGGKLTLDQRAATVAATDYKRLGKEFDKLSNRVGIIPESEIGASIYSSIENNDPVAAKTAIESHFKTLYDAPDANETTGFFSSDLSPEAKARRKQIDTDKALTNTAIDRMLATRSQHAGAQTRMNATRAQADALAIERANAALVAAGMPPMAESGNYREGYAVSQQEQSDAMGSPVNEAVGAEDQADPSKKKADLAPAIPGVKKPKPFFGISDTISGIWDAVSGLGTTAPQAFYQLVEGMERPDKYSPEAKAAFEKARIRSEAMAAKTAARQASGESTSVGESFRESGDSLGFSLGTMAAAAPAIYAGTKAGGKIGAGLAFAAGVAGPQAAVAEEIVTVPVGTALGGTIGGIAAGMAASGGSAYRMAGASFLGESFKVLEENSVAKNGRAMTEEEKQIAFESLLPIAKNTAIWEAGPEAVGNAVTFGFGKIALGIGEPALKSLSKTVLGRLGVRAAAGAGVVGTELATETITQIEQEADQRKAAAIAAGQSPDTQIADYSSEGVVKSFKEVAPQTLALLGLMGGGTAAIKSVLPKSKDTKTPPPGTDASEDTTTLPPEPAPNGKISSAGMLSRAEKHLAGIEEEIAREEGVAEKEITVPNGSGGYDKVPNPNYGFVDQKKLASLKAERNMLANLLADGEAEAIAWNYGFEIGPPGSAAAPLDATPPAGAPPAGAPPAGAPPAGAPPAGLPSLTQQESDQLSAIEERESEELAGLLQKSMTGGALTEAEQTRFKELQAQVAARPTSVTPPTVTPPAVTSPRVFGGKTATVSIEGGVATKTFPENQAINRPAAREFDVVAEVARRAEANPPPTGVEIIRPVGKPTATEYKMTEAKGVPLEDVIQEHPRYDEISSEVIAVSAKYLEKIGVRAGDLTAKNVIVNGALEAEIAAAIKEGRPVDYSKGTITPIDVGQWRIESAPASPAPAAPAADAAPDPKTAVSIKDMIERFPDGFPSVAELEKMAKDLGIDPEVKVKRGSPEAVAKAKAAGESTADDFIQVRLMERIIEAERAGAVAKPTPVVVEGVDHETVSGESNEALNARTTAGDSRNEAMRLRAESAKALNSSLKRGDVVTKEDGTEVTITDVSKSGAVSGIVDGREVFYPNGLSAEFNGGTGAPAKITRAAAVAKPTPAAPAASAPKAAAETEPVFNDTYTGPRWTYGMRNRPVGIGAAPKGYIIGSGGPAVGRARNGTIQYPRELTKEELYDFEMEAIADSNPATDDSATPVTQLPETPVIKNTDAAIPAAAGQLETDGGKAAVKVRKWLNDQFKAGNKIGRYASALDNLNKKELDPDISNTLTQLLREVGVEDAPLSFEGKVYDDFWLDFSNAYNAPLTETIDKPAAKAQPKINEKPETPPETDGEDGQGQPPVLSGEQPADQLLAAHAGVPSSLRATGLEIAEKEDLDGPLQVAIVNGKPVIQYSTEVLQKVKDKLTKEGEDFVAWLQAAVGEEHVHVRFFTAVGAQWKTKGEAIFNALTPAQKKLLKDAYGEPGSSDFQHGGEYVRMLFQLRSGVPVTERYTRSVELEALYPVLEGPQSAVVEEIFRQMQTIVGANPASVDDAPTKTKTPNEIALDKAADDLADGLFAGDPTRVELSLSTEATQDQFRKFLARAAQRTEDESVATAILEEMEENDISPQSVTERFKESTYDNLPEPIQKRFQRMIKSVVGLQPGDVIYTKEEDDGSITLGEAKSWKDVIDVIDAGNEARYLQGTERGLIVMMHLANKGAGQMKQATGSKVEGMKTLGAGNPAASEQQPIPPEKAGQLVAFASAMLATNIRSPEAVAKYLEEKFKGRARSYTRAIWEMMGAIGGERGEQNWNNVYNGLGTAEKPEAIAGTVAERVRDMLLRGEKLNRRTLTAIGDDEMDAKELDEQAELGVVMAGREIAKTGVSPSEIYDQLLDLYERQPNFTAKTSTSKINQAYSTPIPLAYVGSHIAQISQNTILQESTAGNGALAIEANPNTALINEIDPTRAANLRLQGFTVSSEDATKWTPTQKADRLHINPPFGTILNDDGTLQQWTVDGLTTNQVDHAIVIKSLGNLKNDGRAVLIIGGTQAVDRDERRSHYGNGNRADFFKKLYAEYGVIDHFTVNGSLYEKQGAGWPVDVIVIAGRKPSPIQLPNVNPPRILNTWAEVKSELTRTDEERIKAGQYNETRDREELGGNINAIRDALNRRKRLGRTGDLSESPVETDIETGDIGVGDNVGTVSTTDLDGGIPEDSEGGEIGVGDGTIADGTSVGGRLLKEQAKTDEAKSAFHKPYVPVATGKSFGIETPANLAEPQRTALEAIEREVGKPLLEYVREKVGYDAKADMGKYFAAEQIDAIASAIYNIENNGALILGDMAGVGKGRVIAALIEYAKRNDLVPIFVTKNATLYSAMLGDFQNIGRTINPIYTNSLLNFDNPVTGETIKTGNQKSLMNQIERDAKLPDGFDAIFTTYDQIGKDVDPTESAASRSLAKSRNQPPRPGPRTRALESLTARRKTLVMMDESHLGAGASIQGMRLRKILASPNLRAYYSSATFAKRADAMPLYFKTNLRKAAGSAEELLAVFESGGVVMQQVASSMLAKDGQYIRRERSFEGIPFETRINTNTESRDRKLANEYTRGLRGILDMSNRIDEATKSMNKIMVRIGKRMNVPTIKMEGAEFSSQIHNFVKQYLFAIKAEAAAEQTIKAIKEGYETKDGTVKKHKVIIAVENTMEGPIKSLDAQGQSLDFTNLLLNTLNGLRKIKTGGTESNGTATYFTINRDPQPEFLRMSQGELEGRLVRVVAQTDSSGATTQVGVVNEPVAEELFRRLANSQFIETEDEIKGLELGGMPLSPIDYIRQKAEAAGIRTGEITGRSMGIDSEGNTYLRDPKDISKRGQLEILNQFNNTDLDLMIINASGSTGISAHADENFDNLAPRMMIIAQPHLDINEFVQTLGRIFRSGQVEDPRYMLLQTALPAEKRPAAITAGKMASLNANTTSNVDNEVSEAGNSVDIFNEYGDAVVWRFLADNPQFVTGLQYKKITSPTGVLLPIVDILAKMQEDGKFARNVANYGGLLEVEMQDLFWEDVVNRYNAQIAYLDQLGENKLKAGAEDLGAETLDSAIWTSGDPTGKSIFDSPSFLETVAVRPKTPPMEPSEVMNLAKEAAKTKSATLVDYRKTSLKFQEDYLKARKAKTLGDWSMQEPRERQRLLEQFSEVWAQINRLGNPVKIVTKGGQKVGAIIGFEIDPEHPLTPSKQIFIVANNTLKRTFKIPASQMAERVLDMDSTDFEEQYNKTREDKANRYIITGNLVAASAKLNSNTDSFSAVGAVTVYTKSDGTVATGIMLPGSFNPNAKETVRVTTSQEIEKVLNEKKQISGDDGKLAIVRRSGKDYLEIPASKSGGGKYWQDQELNRAMEGRQFVQVGSLMRGEIADMVTVVQKLQSIGVVLTAPITQSSGGPTLGAGNPAQQRRTEDRISNYSDERLARQIPTNAVQREWIKRGVFPANLVYVPTPKEQRDIARLVQVIRNNSYNETGTKASNKVLDAVMDMPLDEKPFIKIGADIYEADGMMIAGNASKVKSFANLKEESANTPQMLAAGNPATPRAQAYSKEAIQSAFNLTSEQAEAADILVKSIGLDESKITVSKGGTAKPDALLQMEDVLSGKEKVPNYDTIAKVVEFIRKYAKTNQVIPKGINLMSSKGRASAVDSIVKHTLLELGEWKKITKNYIPFYTADILERTNPALQKYALEKYGRKLSKSEIAFIHLLSAFGSGQAEPTVDTITGMRVFDEYMRTGRATGYSDKPKPVYKAPAVGESPKRVFIDSKTGEDTFNAKGNSAKFDNTKKAQISKTYNVSGLARFNRVLDYFNGNLDKTIEWLGSQHKFSDIRAVIGDAAADSLKPHEYLNKNGLTFGTFVLGNNPKLGSYILNRWQNLGTITKDMWVARTMSRYFREPNTGEPWGTTVEGNNKRRILDEAWGLVAEKLGVEPAQVQEMMWDAEKKIYSRFGQASEGTYTSQGVEMEIARRAKDVAKGMVAESEEGTGVLQRGSKGAFEFAKDGKSLIRGFKDADVSTGLHEIAHVVRRQLFDRNLLPEQRAGITDADIAITEAWAGVDGMKGWDRLADEKFARGFERYMRDGKAPAENLQPIFAKFKKWMTEVYRKLIGSKIDVKISSAMRQVFDKLVTRSERLKEPTTTSPQTLGAGNPARPAQGNLPITSAPSQTTSSNIPPLPPGSFVQLPSQPTPPNTVPGRIDSVFRRILSGGRWFWEGTADVLERAGYEKLAKAIKYQFDVEAREFGEMWKPIRDVLEKHSTKIIDAAKKEFADYFQNRENGRDVYAATQLTGYSAAGQELIAAWKKVAVETGLRLTNLGVEVQKPDGSWRPIGNLGEKFFPRKINQATMKILEDPEKYPVEWKVLMDALIANGNIATTAEAEEFLKKHVFYETSKSDYFATIEKARTGKLPESWLEYKFDEIAPWYVTHYARRSGQIEAYGQEHKGGDLFDKTLAAMPERKPWSATQAYVKAAKDAAYMRRDNTQLAQGLRNLQTLATGTFLTNPFSSIRNVVSGVTQSAVLFGPIDTLKASWKVLNAMRDKLNLANELGVLRDDMMQMMVETRLVDETTGAQALRKVANLGLTISGFNLAERFARMVALTVASDFARSYRTATGAKKDQMTAFLIRNDANPALIFAGDKKETNSFIRNSVAQGQGSYKFPQTPLYFAEPKVAFLMQFGKWGTQMTRTLTKHAINPAVFGTTVNGKQVRTFMPLLYAVAFAIGGGELLYLIRDLFTDRDRPDASIEEINKALTQNEQEGIQQIANRVFSDIIMAGTLGMFSDYAGNLREFATRNRFKNPFDPAGVQAFKNVFTVLATLKQQRTLTSKDIKDAFETQFSGAKFLDQTVRNITGDKKQEALQTQTEARQAGMRMAKELGMPVQSTFTSSMPVKSPKTPYYTALNDALLTGDVSAARKAVSEFSASLPPAERSKAIKSLGSSVNQKAPIKVGGIAGATQRADFMKWAGKRLPEAQFRRIAELDATYWRTAIRAGVVDRVPQSTKSSFVVPLTRNSTGTSTFDNL